VESLVRYSHGGPRSARVDRVDVHEEQPEGRAGFRVT
jgi:hypothetical protein